MPLLNDKTMQDRKRLTSNKYEPHVTYLAAELVLVLNRSSSNFASRPVAFFFGQFWVQYNTIQYNIKICIAP